MTKYTVTLEGNTRPQAEQLKSKGWRWDPIEKLWRSRPLSQERVDLLLTGDTAEGGARMEALRRMGVRKAGCSCRLSYDGSVGDVMWESKAYAGPDVAKLAAEEYLGDGRGAW